MIVRTRGQIVKWAIFGVNDQKAHKDWTWQEVRPFQLRVTGPHTLDCSAFCIWTYWRAGAGQIGYHAGLVYTPGGMTIVGII